MTNAGRTAVALAKAGAGRRIRTDDLLITNQLLYQLSYAGKKCRSGSERGKLAQSFGFNNVRLTLTAEDSTARSNIEIPARFRHASLRDDLCADCGCRGDNQSLGRV